MKSALAEHFRVRRLEMHVTVGQLARGVGYRNVSKGAKRIHRFEKTGDIDAELLAKLLAFLNVDQAILRSLIEEDRRTFLAQWAESAAQPIKPYLVLKLLPGWYSTVSMPVEVSDFSSAEAFASAKAKEARRQVCLVWSRRLSLYFDATGTVTSYVEAVPGGEHTPWMQIGGKYVLPGMGEIDWPRRPEFLEEEA